MNDKISNDDLDQGFNDDELADIMSEIESLEKEFVDDTPALKEELKVEALKIDVEEVEMKKTDLQAEIDNEVESLLGGKTEVKPEPSIVDEVMAEIEAPVAKLNPLEEAIQAIETEKAKEDVFLTTATSVAAEKVEPVIEEKAMDNVVALKNTRTETVEKVVTPASSSQTQLDFSVAGQMNLKLNFTVAGQTISLYVNEADGMVIEMMGGARFTLPMGEATAKKKAA